MSARRVPRQSETLFGYNLTLRDGLFEADVLAPNQFFERVGSQAQSPEEKLVFAILVDAISDYQHYCFEKSPHGRAFYDDAREWINSTDTTYTFSFENICDIFGLDASSIRTRLEAWRKKRRNTWTYAR